MNKSPYASLADEARAWTTALRVGDFDVRCGTCNAGGWETWPPEFIGLIVEHEELARAVNHLVSSLEQIAELEIEEGQGGAGFAAVRKIARDALKAAASSGEAASPISEVSKSAP